MAHIRNLPHARVGGHGFTWFNWRGNVVAYGQAISHTGPQPVSAPVAIQPLNFRRPAEIMMPRAIGHGVLTITLIELWNAPVWARLQGLADSTDIADVFQTMYEEDDPIIARVVIEPPRGQGPKYFKTYHGCKVVNISDDEQIDVTTMQVNKDVEIWYTWCERTGIPQKYGNQTSP